MDIYLPYNIGTKVFVVVRSDSVKSVCNTCRGSGYESWEDDFGGYRSSTCNGCYGRGEVYPPKGSKQEFIISDKSYEISHYQIKSERNIQVIIEPGGSVVSIQNIFEDKEAAKICCAALNKEIEELNKRLKELTE